MDEETLPEWCVICKSFISTQMKPPNQTCCIQALQEKHEWSSGNSTHGHFFIFYATMRMTFTEITLQWNRSWNSRTLKKKKKKTQNLDNIITWAQFSTLQSLCFNLAFVHLLNKAFWHLLKEMPHSAEWCFSALMQFWCFIFHLGGRKQMENKSKYTK